MPIFEFECPEGHRHERVMQCGSDEWQRERECPECGSQCVRVMSVPGRPRGGDTPTFHDTVTKRG